MFKIFFFLGFGLLSFCNSKMVLALACDVPVSAPAPIVEPPKVQFPALFDLKLYTMNSASVGHPNANEAAQLTLASAIALNAVTELQNAANAATLSFDLDAQGRKVEVRKSAAFESRQTFANGIQYGIVFKDGKKRYQFQRNFLTGAFEGIMIAASFDAFSPMAVVVTPAGNGNSNQLMIIDIGNNKKNDIRGELTVNTANLQPKAFKKFLVFQGGLAGQPESLGLQQKFGGF